jgi:hypothetical protein
LRESTHSAHGHGTVFVHTPRARTLNWPQTSTRNNSTNMDPIASAVADYKSQGPEKQLLYNNVAAKWGVSRTAVSRRHPGISSTRETKYDNLKALNATQQQQLIEYIRSLSRQGLPPTRDMIQNVGSKIAGRAVSESWATRFINQNDIQLISRWATPMDRSRHNADSRLKYKQYYDELYRRIDQYHI